jgi:DNA-directed RNA polymerase specialized sigma24 family protein
MTSRDWTIGEQDQLIAEAVERDEARLRSFMRKRVMDIGDAEDVLQDVFYELTEAYRLTKPIEEVTARPYRVARNRITDLFRRKKAVSLSDLGRTEGGETVMTPDVGEAGRPFVGGSREAKLQVVPRDQERKMTDEELGGMSLESLLYYVLVGEGRRSL